MSFSVTAAGSKEMVQKLPSLFIDNLVGKDYSDNKGYYHNASYSGYTVREAAKDGSEEEKAEFSVTVAIEGRESAYKPEKTDKPEDKKAE